MKTVIYYFTGTGNSLALARKVAKDFPGEVELLPITRFAKEQHVEINGDVLGIIFPVYFLSVPDSVRSFLKKLTFCNNPYIFAVATCNAQPGHSLYTVARLLKAQKQSLATGFAVDMPGNAFGKMNSPDIQKERLANSAKRVSMIGKAVRERQQGILEGSNHLKLYVRGYVMKSAVMRLLRPVKKFQAQNQCIRCGSCGRVCPQKNIRIDPKRGPIWGSDCQLCLACFHWCPWQAIQMGEQTLGIPRYNHPEITIDEMMKG